MKPLLVLLVLSLIVIAPVMADDPPKLPMAVDGFVTVNGNPAPIGTVIVAHATNAYPGAATITLTETGKFGNPGDPFADRIFIHGTKSGQVANGDPITFTVNGASAYVRVSGTSAWGTSVPYTPGGMVFIDLATGAVPVSTTEPTPVPTTIQPTQIPTSEPTTIIPTTTPTPNHNTKATISIYDIPKKDCPGSFYYGIPDGYGVLHVSGSGSCSFFYINGALIVNGGSATLKGMAPGTYTLSYKEAGCIPFESQIEIISGKVTSVSIEPYRYSWELPEWENAYVCYIPMNVVSTTGDFTLLSYPRGATFYIDDVAYSGCDIPCDATFRGLSPGIHTMRYVTDTINREFKVVICASTRTAAGWG